MNLSSHTLQDITSQWKPNSCISDGQFIQDIPTGYNYAYELLPSQYTRGKIAVEMCDSERMMGVHSPYAGKLDHHHSVFAHDHTFWAHQRTTGRVGGVKGSKVALQWLWLEIDGRSIGDSMNIARGILRGVLWDHLNAVRVFWSGNRSIHLAVDGQLFGNLRGSQDWLAGDGGVAYQLAHKLTAHLTDTPMPYMLDDEQAIIAAASRGYYADDSMAARKHLEVIDPNLYRVNSTIRLANSIHPKTMKPKVEIGVQNLLKNHIEYSEYNRVNIAPKLLYLVVDCMSPIVKQSSSPSTAIHLTTTQYEKVFSHYLNTNEGIHSYPWISKLYSPFYADTNPSVSINIETGFYYDFGAPTHRFSIDQFVSKLERLDIVSAAAKIMEIAHA